MKTTSILLVEDDLNLGDILKEYLSVKGFDTTLCRNGQEGYDTYKSKKFDLCILDVMMPVMDGFTLAHKIRTEDEDTPIVFLTAKALKDDKIEGFKVGGDDYLTKPFSMEELMLRINAILRRTNTPTDRNEDGSLSIGKYTFNPLLQILEIGQGQNHRLTTKEALLLKLLIEHKNRVLARDYALKTIWGDDNYFNGRSMDVFITKLRKYLKDDANVEIMNVHGQGYKLIDM
ncbi:MAG: response regulator transcription factor [Sphingobacteriales bacterium]|nr:response regulator transcription factor [Sphingobacteriales bacterium]